MIERFCDGGVKIETMGACARATWHAKRGQEKIPVLSLIVPRTCLHTIAGLFEAAYLLEQDDHVGPPAGNA